MIQYTYIEYKSYGQFYRDVDNHLVIYELYYSGMLEQGLCYVIPERNFATFLGIFWVEQWEDRL